MRKQRPIESKQVYDPQSNCAISFATLTQVWHPRLQASADATEAAAAAAQRGCVTWALITCEAHLEALQTPDHACTRGHSGLFGLRVYVLTPIQTRPANKSGHKMA